ncbi:MAG: hypothetical protein AAF391_03215 [Bacteroidota bacterium]
MPSEKLYREFQNLERKIQLALSENKRLKDDLAQSEAENQVLKSKLENQQDNLNTFQSQMKMNKIANNMMVEDGESAQLKAQIDGYIKEIDKCIAHLAE